MKKVFSSNSDVCHAFAQRTYPEGKSGSVFFYGDKIYSWGYHYLLGEFIDDKTIIINDVGYSSSTGKHINILRGATSQYRQLFTTDIELSLVYEYILNANKKLENARKPERYVTEIITRFETLNRYLTEFKRTSLLKTEAYKKIKKIYKSLKKDEGKYIEDAKIRMAKEKAALKKKHQKQLEKFFNHEVDRLYSPIIKEDYIRISQDKEKIETTQGVKIQINEARELYRAIKAGVDIKGKHIGGYTINSLNGHLTVGCHKINVKNMHEIGIKICE
jgi:hypothetical protein